jgi:dTDP-4-amino-4,6-dideoxygalactose transaminase
MFVPFNEVDHVLERLHSIKCLARTMFKQPLNTYPFYSNQKYLPNVKKFVENLVHLPCHQFMEQEELDRIKNIL